MDKPLFIAKISNESGVIETAITFESKTIEDATAAIKTIHKSLDFLNRCYSKDVELSAPTVKKAIYDPKNSVWTVEELENEVKHV